MDDRNTKISFVGVISTITGFAVIASGFIGALWLVVIVIKGLLGALGVM